MTPHNSTFQLGASDTVLLTVKAQLSRLGYDVGDADSPEFDRDLDGTIKHFQQRRGLFSDGILGPQTFEQIELARHKLGDRILRFDPVRTFRGDDVAELQTKLSDLGLYASRIDFDFAETTDAAVRDLQKNLGLTVDGVAGPRTLRGLDAVSRGSASGSIFALQEKARLQSSGPSLSGRTFVIDSAPALPMADDAQLAQHTAKSGDYSRDIAQRISGRLAAVGASPFVLDTNERAASDLLDSRASTLISVSQDMHTNPSANGVATFYFGTATGQPSPIGKRLAELIQREVLSRTDFLDCGSHARSWKSLHEYSTPTVHVVVGYITNDDDSARLHSARVRDSIAESVAVALQRLYLTDAADPETGAVDLAALRDMIARTADDKSSG
ncbi:N-acetylmuramoyl-L-alanine amidase [Brevibacterium jeotgali]|uniref:N-acetylmuramoyl-L-alanine amidase n=1 Tax=Brevibacterium jeotgali TaxID=1262550 RepID=A0A2H1L4W5_9MICO|nr:peptidoglycan-binding protein [Brevibacterium jeotgali]TWC01458.1 N-acetylmuramoyl-L-alanine amidase [Brevibacterium jeotgali]SMY11936.1 N-acetylmuramoyl-L-alanine amidase [Brevibacterium jeotgali]